MAYYKTSRKKTNPAKHFKKTYLAKEIWGLLFLFVSVFTFLALASYNHLDPSVFSSSLRTPSNIGGRVGAHLSDILIQICGLGAFFLVLLFFSISMRSFKKAESKYIIGNIFWLLLAFIAGTTLMSLLAKTLTYGGLNISPGGIIGKSLSTQLLHYFNKWGASLVCLFVLSAATVFGTPFSIQVFFKSIKYLARLAWATLQKSTALLIQALRATFEHQKKIRLETTKKLEKIIEDKKKDLEKSIFISKEKSPEITVAPKVETKQQMELTFLEREDAQEENDDFTVAEEPKKPRKLASTLKQIFKPSLSNWTIPSLELLKEPPHTQREINKQRLIENSKNLETKLSEFGISGQVVAVRPGPVITMYEFKPGAGVKISQIASRADDLSLALEAQSIRIVAPIPGKSVVGIELPNEERETVYLKELLGSKDYQNTSHAIPIVVGKDAAGAATIVDIAATPHLLVAGSSGSGKSVFINTLITSLLYRFTPKDLRMIMVDPKQLELALYDRIPHLLLPVVDDPTKASTALRWTCNEMERRYTIMARAGVRNLKGFNQKLETEGQEKMRELLCPKNEDGTAKASNISHLLEHDSSGMPVIEHLPFIVVVIDEFADLMMIAKKDIETNVSRLAAKARASGIHLVIATQRPSTDVITGVIKNNLPCRVAFKVPSQFDSRTILDHIGAEKLLGRGDMLFIPPNVSRLERVHGAYIDEDEISKICDFWRSQGEPEYKEEILVEEAEKFDSAEADGVADPLYQHAISIVKEEGQASASRLQRRLSVGYNRAARMIESMEAQGLVGPASGSKPREVIY